SAMRRSQGQPSATSRSGGVLVTSVTTRPMNHGTALSPSATSNSTTNRAANNHLAWRAKCHRKASRLGGGSGCSGAAVGVKNRSKRDNICGWLQAAEYLRQSGLCEPYTALRRLDCGARCRHDRIADLFARAGTCHRPNFGAARGQAMAADPIRRNSMACFAGALIALLAAVTLAVAEIFPSRPVTMMVGFPPGGPTDTLARIVADAMQGPLGQPVVVETLSGASGTIATGRVVHARPDGYTIGIGQWSSHVASPAIYPLDYDILRD